MEPHSEDLTRKRKKYSKRYFLTTSKKCKWYRTGRTDGNIDNPDISDILTSSESEHGVNADEPTQKVENDRAPVYSKNLITSASKHNKKTQTHISKQTSSVQAVPQTKLKYVQMSKEFTISTAVQMDTQKKKEEKKTSGVLLQEQLHLNSDFDKFAEKLHDNEQTQKFIKCISCLSKGTLPFTNMAWKSFLEMGSLLSCTSTTTMEYDKE